MVLSFLALPLSGIAAFLASLTLVFDHVIPWSGYVKASLIGGSVMPWPSRVSPLFVWFW